MISRGELSKFTDTIEDPTISFAWGTDLQMIATSNYLLEQVKLLATAQTTLTSCPNSSTLPPTIRLAFVRPSPNLPTRRPPPSISFRLVALMSFFRSSKCHRHHQNKKCNPLLGTRLQPDQQDCAASTPSPHQRSPLLSPQNLQRRRTPQKCAWLKFRP